MLLNALWLLLLESRSHWMLLLLLLLLRSDRHLLLLLHDVASSRVALPIITGRTVVAYWSNDVYTTVVVVMVAVAG
jgi:hypothetical protein